MTHHDVAVQIHDERPAGAARDFDQFFSVFECMEVGTADSAGESFDQDLARPGSRRRDIVNHDFFVTHDGGAHLISPDSWKCPNHSMCSNPAACRSKVA